MKELLFKLKKDGKCVGYMKFAPAPHNLWAFWSDNNIDWVSWEAGKIKPVDSIHPFVTKDRNGKDVFADDKIMGILTDTASIIKGTIYWCDYRYGWKVRLEYMGKFTTQILSAINKIELIEDN